MQGRPVTISPTETQQARTCQCGCAPCEGDCCQLDCQVQPRFFYGQLLTDQDLTALLAWTENKFRLTRFREGWGVVCGLDVHCDPERPGHVAVSPGYAVSCCGHDIVVCEPASVDVRVACGRPEDCEEPYSNGRDKGKKRQVSGELAQRKERDGTCVVDLYVSYATEPADPQSPLGRGSCSTAGGCEYARTRETYKLMPQAAIAGRDPVKDAADGWCNAYDECFEVVDRFCRRFPAWCGRKQDEDNYDPGGDEGKAAAAAHRWLLDWVDKHPSGQVCNVREDLCEIEPSGFTRQDAARVLFRIVQSCLGQFLACDCHTCHEGPGVPLARVWLQARTERGAEQWVVRHVDPYPPYRRLIGRDCWPAYLGSVNAARVIWQRPEEAVAVLAGQGIQVERVRRVELPDSPAEVTKLLGRGDCGRFFPRMGSHVSLEVIQQWPEGYRVVGVEASEPIGKTLPWETVPPPDAPEPAPGQPYVEPVPAPRDDLEKVHGLGPATAQIMVRHGINTYAELAEMPWEKLLDILTEARVRGMSEERAKMIVESARKLAEEKRS